MLRKLSPILLLLIGLFLLSACINPISDEPSQQNKLKVVATTTIVGDIVDQIAGDLVELDVLLPTDSDPHTFEPTPQDVAMISEADLIFANGAGLETFLKPLLVSAGAADKLVHVSESIELIEFTSDIESDPEHAGGDPHVWTSPNKVKVWVKNVASVLSDLDQSNAAAYQANAEHYQDQLTSLDTWIREQVSLIPTENREIVTDHLIFGYFSEEYGFNQVGALIPGYSTQSKPSAREMAQIEDAVQQLGVKAIFVGYTVNPSLATRVAEDTGTQLVYLHTGSLSKQGGEADTYLDYMRFNVNAIINALR